MATHEEFLDFLVGEVERGGMNEPQVLDLLIQKAHYDARRRYIEASLAGSYVGFTGGRMYVDDSLAGILERGGPRHLVYFECAGRALNEVDDGRR
ncbi:MAG TPA: hypothetical protein VGD01_09520 [Candidatus Elarobacter sp.]|jgi:hypothetical protein